MELNDEQVRYIEQLYVEMYYPLSAYAQSALSDRSLAEEAVQESFRIACAKVEKLMESLNPKGWITNALKFVIQNTKRNRARLNQLVVSVYSYDENLSGEWFDEIDLEVSYSGLINKEEFLLIKRLAIDGYSFKEVAYELGLSIDACKKRFSRAKKKLKERLGN